MVTSTGSGETDQVDAPRTMSRTTSTGTDAPSSSPLAAAPRTLRLGRGLGDAPAQGLVPAQPGARLAGRLDLLRDAGQLGQPRDGVDGRALVGHPSRLVGRGN